MVQCNRARLFAVLVSLTFATNLVAQQAEPANDPGRPIPAAKPPAAAQDSPPTSIAAANERIREVLNQPLREPLDFVNQPLRDVATILMETYGIPIVFDTAALDAVAASPDVEVTLQINNVRLETALNLMLKNAGAEALTYIVDNEVLLITTEEEAQSRLEVKVYRVDDLVGDDPSSSLDAADADTLIDIIVASVEHESWQQNQTGEGEIRAFPPGMIVVSQTHRVHEQLERLLDDLRRGKAEVQQRRAAEHGAAADRPSLRAIRVFDPGLAEPRNRQVIEQSIQQSVDWEAYGDDVTEDDVFLHVLQDRVLVRHLPEVIRQVELAVREIAPPVPGGLGMRARGGQSGGRGGRGGF